MVDLKEFNAQLPDGAAPFKANDNDCLREQPEGPSYEVWERTTPSWRPPRYAPYEEHMYYYTESTPSLSPIDKGNFPDRAAAQKQCMLDLKEFNAQLPDGPAYFRAKNNDCLKGQPEGPSYEVWERTTFLWQPPRFAPYEIHRYYYTENESPQQLSAEAINAGAPNCAASVGNPIHAGTGNKYQREADLVGWSPFAAAMVRHYNSQVETVDGQHWRHTWQRRISVDGFEYTDAQGNARTLDDTLALVRPDGRELIFYKIGAKSLAATSAEIPDDIPAVGTDEYPLEWIGSEWRYRTDTGEREYYDEQGRLQRITDARGYTQTVKRDGQGRISRVVGPYGRALVFAYDSDGTLASVTDPLGRAVDYGYDGDGRLVSVTDRTGATRRYHYGDSGAPADALTGITDANGDRFATWTYDEQGRAITSEHAGGAERTELDYRDDGTVHVTDANGAERIYTLETVRGRKLASRVDGDGCSACGAAREREYNDRGLPTRVIDRKGNVTTYAYNAAGLVTERTEAAGTAAERTVTMDWDTGLRRPVRITEPGRVTEYTYDEHGRRLTRTRIDTATGHARTTTWQYHPERADGTPGRLAAIDGPRSDVDDVTRFEYDAQGNRTRVTNAAGHVTGITAHDAYGRPTEIVDPNGLLTQLVYDAAGRIAQRDRGGRVTRFAYDAVGQLVRLERPDGSVLHYEYDAAHRLTAIEDGDGHRVEYTLDAGGNRTAQYVHDASGAVARAHRRAFDQLGRLIRTIGAQGQSTTYQYDANGNRTWTTDPAGATVNRAFDALDRVIRQTDAMGGTTAFAYDRRDRVTAVTDPNGNVTRYTYNGFGDRTKVDSPDAGVTTYAHNAAGQVIEETDARGRTTSYTRDALGRRTRADYADGTSATFVWDQGDNGIGRLARIEEPSATTEWAYNAFGQVTERTQTADGITLTTRYEYDAAGRRTAMVYPSGTRVTYTHDEDEVTTLTVNGEPVLEGIEYEPFGPVSDWTWGDGDRHTRAYDRDGRLVAHAMPDGTRMLAWSADDRVTGITGPESAKSYGYDANDRLSSASSHNGHYTYRYDANGNRTSRGIDGEQASYTYADDSNRLHQVSGARTAAYTYDAAGNMTGDGEHQYRYGPRGRMRSVDGGDTAEYRYNALGQRVYKRAQRDRPDYAALAKQARQQADALAGQAQNLRQDAVEARQAANAATRDAEKARRTQQRTQRRAERHERIARQHHRRAERWQDRADRYTDRADRYRERAANIGGAWWAVWRARYYNWIADLYGGVGEWYQGSADEAAKRAERSSGQAETARGDAEAAGRRAERAEAEAEAARERAEHRSAEAKDKQTAAADKRQQAAEYRRRAAEQSPPMKTTRFVYGSNDRLIGRYGKNGHAEREYIRLGTRPVATVDRNGQIHYIHTDHLGTPRVVSMPGGDVVWRWQSSPFGEGEPDENPDGKGRAFELRLRFPGQYHDHETGRHYNYFRSYDPSIGRYVSSDPIGLAGGLNTYGYVVDDPINMVDPLGLERIYNQGSSGLFVQGQVTGGTGQAGGKLSVTISDTGITFTGGAGVGIGAGATLVGGVQTSQGATDGASGFASASGGYGPGVAYSGGADGLSSESVASNQWGFGLGIGAGAAAGTQYSKTILWSDLFGFFSFDSSTASSGKICE
jgi:RHS repeat-associated protein